MYHRKLIFFINSQLQYSQEGGERSPNLPSRGAPLSLSKATLGAPLSISQATLGAPLSISKATNHYQHFTCPPPPPHSLGLPLSLLSAQLILPSPSDQGQQRVRDPHTPPPLLSMVSSDAASWPRYCHLEIT
jgi:hypothetical protein